MPMTQQNKTTSKNAPLQAMPSAETLAEMRAADSGYQMAQQDAVKFLYSRRQAIYNIARKYRLDPEELLQEGYEILLTCLRDFCPVYEKNDGTFTTVQFTTFFGSRIDGRAMEMRNHDPEYQARAAMTQDMSSDEKAAFRQDPPLLVQHLDQDTTLQEALSNEAASARDEASGDANLQVVRDSFFEKKLNELIAQEADEKKRSTLMHVKVGGVFNFQEMAYHFGVTDSRASQILNELMDAFYVQRLLDNDLKSVAYDFHRMKMNAKRVTRLLIEALQVASPDRAAEIGTVFGEDYPDIQRAVKKASKQAQSQPQQMETGTNTTTDSTHMTLQPARELLTEEEQKQYPLQGQETWATDKLTAPEVVFRAPRDAGTCPDYIPAMAQRLQDYPLLINTEGTVIDGVRRLQAAQAAGMTEVPCQVRRVPADDVVPLRVGLNLRAGRPDKIAMYWSIVALAQLGLSQQKIADALGISRTNTIVYMKVLEKAVPELRQLFEDGLIQITNASQSADLDEKTQVELAQFIRTYGAMWGKGSRFTEVFTAAENGDLPALQAKLGTPEAPPAPSASAAQPMQANGADAQAVHQYQQALRDAEIWSQQREAVINRQTEELEDARTEIERLKNELDAAELSRFADDNTLQEALKELKQVIALTERMNSAHYAAQQARKQLRNTTLTRTQLAEIRNLMDTLEKETNALRVEITGKTSKR